MEIEVGASAEAAVTVDQHNTATAMGSGNVPAFATPALVALCERAAVYALKRYLEEGQDSVGSGISIKHLSPTPVGKQVRAEATITAVEGRKVSFSVAAFDAQGKVGEGTHERVLIDREQFIWRLVAKGCKPNWSLALILLSSGWGGTIPLFNWPYQEVLLARSAFFARPFRGSGRVGPFEHQASASHLSTSAQPRLHLSPGP